MSILYLWFLSIDQEGDPSHSNSIQDPHYDQEVQQSRRPSQFSLFPKPRCNKRPLS